MYFFALKPKRETETAGTKSETGAETDAETSAEIGTETGMRIVAETGKRIAAENGAENPGFRDEWYNMALPTINRIQWRNFSSMINCDETPLDDE